MKVAQVLVLAASVGLTSSRAVPALAAPAVFTVNACNDAADGIPGDGKCETREKTCTLRAAIMEANQAEAATIKVGGIHVRDTEATSINGITRRGRPERSGRPLLVLCLDDKPALTPCPKN